jgi:hypothetical protein
VSPEAALRLYGVVIAADGTAERRSE